MNKFKYLLLALSLHMTAFTMDELSNGASDQNLQNQGFLPDLILAPHLDGTSGLISGFDLVGPDATFNFDNLDGESDIAPLPVQPEVATSATHSPTAPPKQYQCNVCAKIFFSTKSLYQHNQTKHKGIGFLCNFPNCNKIYTSKQNLKIHQKKHNDLSSLPPELGEFDSAVPAPFSPTLEEIIYYHAPHHLPPVQPAVAVSAPLPFAHQAVADYAPLPVQPVVHDPHHLPPVQPEVAVSAPYWTPAPLPPAYSAVAVSAPLPPVLAAAATAANDLVQSHTCPVCSRSFVNRSMLKRHKLIHSEEKRFKCDQEGCEYSSKDSSALKVHKKRRHSGKLPAASTPADSSTVVSASLPPNVPFDELSAAHPEVVASAPLPPVLAAAATAANDRLHTCPFCQRSFTRRSNLNSHLLIHSGERPFVCDTCGNSFRQSQTLKRHKGKHTGKLPAASTPADSSTVVPAPLPPNVPFDELPAAQPEVAASPPLPPTLSFTNGADQVSDDNDDESI